MHLKLLFARLNTKKLVIILVDLLITYYLTNFVKYIQNNCIFIFYNLFHLIII
jgi:hypothetical protein